MPLRSALVPPRLGVATLAVSAASTLGPLTVDSGGRYLKTASGTPWRYQCDGAWFICNHLSQADQDTYLAALVAAGYNAAILCLLEHPTTAWPQYGAPANFYGEAPFTTANQFDTPNAAYFARVNRYIDKARSLGLIVPMFHTYSGFGGGDPGWEAVYTDGHNTNTVMRNWGIYLATTFTQDNIIWMHFGDNTQAGTALTRFQNVVSGIQSITRNRLSGSEIDYPNTQVTDQTGFTYGIDPGTSDMQLNSFYGQDPSGNGQSYIDADVAWAYSPTLPSRLQEPAY